MNRMFEPVYVQLTEDDTTYTIKHFECCHRLTLRNLMNEMPEQMFGPFTEDDPKEL